MAKTVLYIGSNPWSPAGAGSGTTSISISVSQTFTMPYTPVAAKFWLAGNGISPVHILSAWLIQGSKNIPLKVNGATSFYIPAFGRWSDYVSISDFTLPGTVTLTVIVESEQPFATFSGNPNPDEPVIVSVIETPLSGAGLTGEILFDCEYEGTFVDSVNGFTPTVQNCTIETEDVLFGSGSCFMDGSDENLPASGAILTYITNSEFVNRCAEEGFTLSLFIKLIDPIPGYPAGSRIHQAYVFEKVSGGYNGSMYIEGALSSPLPFVDDATLEYLLLTLMIGTTYRWIIDGCQIIKGAVWTEDFTPPSVPFTSTLDNDPIELTFNSTITLTSNPTAGDTLILKGGTDGDVTFTFVDHYPRNQYEIQICATANDTAASIAPAINNIPGAEFVATAADNVIGVIAYTSTFSMEKTGDNITLGVVTRTHDGLITEDISAADSFTAEDGGKAVQENVSVADTIDGLIDGLSESASVSDLFDVPMDELDESVSVSTNFDGLIDAMGESND